MTGTTVAAFDFDGTLTDRDTVVPFLRRLAGIDGLGLGLASALHRVAPAAVRRDRDALRAVATDRVFRRRTIDEVVASAREYGATLVAERLRADTTARLRWHRDLGHRVVIVSASYEQYVHEVGTALGVDEVLATRLEVVDGRCTGRLDGRNCRGPEKVRRLHTWFAEQRLDPSEVTLWAYGDSSGDRELLAEADHPHWVRDRLTPAVPSEA